MENIPRYVGDPSGLMRFLNSFPSTKGVTGTAPAEHPQNVVNSHYHPAVIRPVRGGFDLANGDNLNALTLLMQINRSVSELYRQIVNPYQPVVRSR